MRGRLGRAFNVLVVLLGVGLFVGLLLGLDTRAIVEQLARSGWVILPAFPIYVANLLCSVMAWRECIEPGAGRGAGGEHGRRVRVSTLLKAFWAGHAVNGVGVAAMGEVVKGNLLARELKGEEALASLVIHGYLNGLSIVALTVFGPAVCLLWIDLPSDVVGAIFGVTSLFCLVFLGLRVLLRRGVAVAVLGRVAKLPVVDESKVLKLEAKAAFVDERVRRFRQERPASLRRAVAWSFGARALQTLEVWVLLLGLAPATEALPADDPLTLLLLALLTHSTAQIIRWAAAFVPARVGVAEGGMAALFRMLGLGTEVGLSLAILRRVRRMLGFGIGLAIAAAAEARFESGRGGREPV